MINIKSDFRDYYDDLSNAESNIVYERYRQTGKTRAEDLKFLRDKGIQTIACGTVSQIIRPSMKKLVVYTSPTSHQSSGKHIYSLNDVLNQYSNCVVSEFLENYGGYTVKYLQIGERRFRLMFLNPNYREQLIEGNMVAIEELQRQYNYAFGLPIYSIDYISNGCEMLAIDFNSTQCLKSIGMDKILKASDVVTEVKNALIAYNKV